MGAHSLLAAACALCFSQLAAGSEGPGGSVSLVQRVVRVHETEEQLEAAEQEDEDGEIPEVMEHDGVKGTFLLTNDFLMHSGPGVRYRTKDSMEAVVEDMQKYMPWGTVFNGTIMGGYVIYNGYFVPFRVNGKEVVTLMTVLYDPWEASKPTQAPKPVAMRSQPRRRSKFHYAPTEVQTPFGGWAPCKILRAGSKEGTYNIEVHPSTFAPYNMNDVPAASLKKVQKIHEFLPVTPAVSQVTSLARDMDSTISLTVNNTKTHTLMELKMMQKSPMRTLMKMACERAGVTWFKCDKKVQFLWKNKPVSQDAHTYELGMKAGEVINMVV